MPKKKIRRQTGSVFTSADKIQSKQLFWYGNVTEPREMAKDSNGIRTKK